MKISIVSALAFLGLAVAAPSPQAASGPPPGEVYITDLKYSGSGCRPGTASQVLAGNLQSFTIAMSEFVATVGPGVPTLETRKNCQIIVQMRYPNGYQFSIFQTIYKGYAQLDRGVTGTQQTNYYFAGVLANQQATARSRYTGPFDDIYTIVDNLAMESRVWSPCGAEGTLNINAMVSLNNAGARDKTGYFAVDSIDGVVKQIFAIQWRTCRR